MTSQKETEIERASGDLGRKTREEIGKRYKMTAPGFQTGDRKKV